MMIVSHDFNKRDESFNVIHLAISPSDLMLRASLHSKCFGAADQLIRDLIPFLESSLSNSWRILGFSSSYSICVPPSLTLRSTMSLKTLYFLLFHRIAKYRVRVSDVLKC